MSRLTKYNRQGKAIYDSRAYVINENPFDAIFEKLAHYEDLEEQGRLIELPCKVGDTVYHLAHGYIEPEKVQSYMVHFSTNVYGFTEDKYGKTVFPTEEEAEARLEELRGDKHDA